MKRSISILITLCMLISLLPMGMTVASATNTETTPTLLFEMDLTDPSNTAGAAVAVVAATEATKTNVTGDINTKVVYTADNTQKPIFNKLSNGTPYLTFAHTPVQKTTNTGTTEAPVYTPVAGSYTYSNTNARVVVPMSASIAAKDALTVETWVRNVVPSDDKSGAKKIMAFGLNKIANADIDKDQMAMTLQWNDSGNQGLCMYGDPALTGVTSGSGLGIYPENINAWSHLVVTREWIADTTDTAKGRWKTTGYINGALFATTYYPPLTKDTTDRTDLTAEACADWKSLIIGGCTYEPNQSFRGDIATFKLYDGILDGATVLNKFSDEAADFGISGTNVNKVFELEIPDAGNTVGQQVVNVKATDDTAVYVKSVVAGAHNNATQKPIYRKTANGTPYLTFADAAGTTLGAGENIATKHPWANASSRVGVTFIDSLNIPNENVITMAAWVKADYVAEDSERGPSNIMSIGQDSVENGFRWRWNVSTTSTSQGMRLDNDTKITKNSTTKQGQSLGAHTELDGRWSHLVVTRKWVPEIKGEGDAQTIGHWENTLYVNGVLVKANILEDIKATERSNFADGTKRNLLAIGGSNAEGSQSFRGDIGAFSLYKAELTPGEVKNLFNESVGDFYPGVDPYKVFDLVLTPGESWADGATGTATDYTYSSTTDTLNAVVIDTNVASGANARNFDLPTLHKENGIQFLRFAYRGQDSNMQNISSQLNFKLNDTKLVEGDAITFETWARSNEMQSNSTYTNKYMFALGGLHQGWSRLGDATRVKLNAGILDLYPDAGASQWCADATAIDDTMKVSHNNISVYNGMWVHYVITREWTPDNANDYYGAGTWTSKLYVNGELASTQTVADTNRSNRAEDLASNFTSNRENDYLTIGGGTMNKLAEAFPGDIATFKVYNKTFTDAEIAAKFADDLDTYYPGKVLDKTKAFELTFTQDGEGGYTAGATSGMYVEPTKIERTSTTDAPLTLTEDGVPFVRFAYKDEETGAFVNTNAALDYKLNNTDLVDGDVITFEAWARSNHIGEDYTYIDGEETKPYRNKRFFALGDHPVLEREGEAVRVQFNEIASLGVSGNFTLYPDCGTDLYITSGAEQQGCIGLMDVSKHSGQWTHYVVTREWTPDDEDDYFGAGTWTSKLYVNGKLANTGTYEDTDRVCRAADYKGPSTTYLDNDYLAIGGSLSENNCSFAGDIAKFNVYGKTFTDDEIKSLYNASVSTFYDGVAYASIKHNNGAELNTTNVASAQSLNIDAYIVEYAPTDAPFVMVALYDANGLVGCKKLAATVDDDANTVTIEDSYVLGALRGKFTDVRVFILDGAETLRPLYTAPHL